MTSSDPSIEPPAAADRAPAARHAAVTLAGWLLIGLGLLSTVGILAGSRTVRLFGIASLASPLLVVYSEVGGYKLMELETWLELTDAEGTVHKIRWDRSRYNEVARQENPFNRHLIILGYASAVNLMLDPRSAPAREQYLRQGLCGDGPLRRYLRLPHPLTEVRVTVHGEYPADKVLGDFHFRCPQ